MCPLPCSSNMTRMLLTSRTSGWKTTHTETSPSSPCSTLVKYVRSNPFSGIDFFVLVLQYFVPVDVTITGGAKCSFAFACTSGNCSRSQTFFCANYEYHESVNCTAQVTRISFIELF